MILIKIFEANAPETSMNFAVIVRQAIAGQVIVRWTAD
jgi:hypothetical protein